MFVSRSRRVAVLAVVACLLSSAAIGAIGPRLPLRLPSVETADRCLELRAASLEALTSGDATTAIARIRPILEIFPDSWIESYNLACALSRTGEAKKAFDVLLRTRDLGGLHVLQVSTDPDLEAV